MIVLNKRLKQLNNIKILVYNVYKVYEHIT
jgi:hypothetical protein